MKDKCKTRYPIMFIHGLGYRDDKTAHYWGRIPETLRAYGAFVCFGNQDSYGAVETNAKQLKAEILKVLDEIGSEKINLIAHSKGGLEARYMISLLKMDDKVASLTTMSTPHHGSRTIDKVLTRPKLLIKTIAKICNRHNLKAGDSMPDADKVFEQLSTDYTDVFNEMVKDSPEVYYQSFAFKMKNPASFLPLALTNLIVKKREGENDGLVTPASAKWGNFRGVFSGIGMRGISHSDVTDTPRKAFGGSRKSKRLKSAESVDRKDVCFTKSGYVGSAKNIQIDNIAGSCDDTKAVYDIVDLYVDIVSDLKNRRY